MGLSRKGTGREQGGRPVWALKEQSVIYNMMVLYCYRPRDSHKDSQQGCTLWD